MSGKLVAVLGAGKMGAGIAQVAAQGGYQVLLRDLNLTLVQEGLRICSDNLNIDIEKKRISPEKKDEILSRINITTDFSSVKDADIVIESAVENMSVKKQIFIELDNICSEQAILATNTSSLSIAEIASVARKRDRILGMHFHDPVPNMNLVEIVRGFETSDVVLDKAKEFVNNINKTFVVLTHESPGYIIDRLLFTYLNESISLYFEGAASCEDIDKAMQEGLKMPMGPLALADSIGLDYLHASLLTFYDTYKDPKYAPHLRFTSLVKAGFWGRKTGKGFYQY